MPWYYVDNGQQAGPVSESEFEGLVASGQVAPDTLVWKEGMENWQPYSQVRPAGVTAAFPGQFAPGAGQPPVGETGYGMYAGAGTGVQCNECGRYYGEDEVIRYGTASVCAGCKPAFVQRLKEGGNAFSGTMDFAGFWVRLGAKFIDRGIEYIISFAIGAVVGIAAGGDQAEVIAALLGLVATFAYYVYFHGRFGQTPGKMALRLRVVRSDGSPISYGRAAGRFFAEILSGLILAIGYIMAAFDEEKRTLHDRLCDTRVIRI